MLMIPILLSGCNISATQPDFPSPEAQAGVEQAARECLNAWVNSEATSEGIDAGISTGVLGIDPETDLYQIQTKDGPMFDEWTIQHGVPWARIRVDIRLGPGCPYVPLSSELKIYNQLASQCLGMWLRTRASQQCIADGIDRGVLVIDSLTNHYQVNVNHEAFRDWLMWDDSIPWDTLRPEVVYGSGCPYQ